jgi:hypothetical protein
MNVTFMHFLPREDNQTADFLSNRFRPPSPQHNHLAKYSFSKAVKSQVKVKLEIGQKLTNEDLEQLVKDSPNWIEPKTEEVTPEIFDPKSSIPCETCRQD